jgi:nucleoside-diphosphate-sugar epimerase
MRVVVAGAGGYIGNAVAKELARRGHEVYGIVRNRAYVSQRVPVFSLAFARRLSDLSPVVSAANDLTANEVTPIILDLNDLVDGSARPSATNVSPLCVWVITLYCCHCCCTVCVCVCPLSVFGL